MLAAAGRAGAAGTCPARPALPGSQLRARRRGDPTGPWPRRPPSPHAGDRCCGCRRSPGNASYLDRTYRNPRYPAMGPRHHQAKRNLPAATCTAGTLTTLANASTCLLPTWSYGAPRLVPARSPPHCTCLPGAAGPRGKGLSAPGGAAPAWAETAAPCPPADSGKWGEVS
nr:putative uncharacterized protein GUCA1ANB isoform X1 [Oryctolagus cuniculus]